MAVRIKGKNPRKPYTTRYFYEGRQREKSFRTAAEEAAFRAKFEHDSREQIFVDPKVANVKFSAAAQEWLSRHQGSPKTIANYEMALRRHLLPEFGNRGLQAVALDRDGVEAFVRVRLAENGLGPSMQRTCYMILNAIVNDAIKRGTLTRTRLRGVNLPAVPHRAQIVWASRKKIEAMAAAMPEPLGATIYLMRGCGLRLGEALGVFEEDMRGGVLRLKRQLQPNGLGYRPLKHRKESDYRDIPVPGFVSRQPFPDSFPAISHRAYRDQFNWARDAAGLPAEFTPHMLRHIFASVHLAAGVPITDVSAWLGHKNIQVTYGIYGHLVPASADRGRKVLDEEWES